MNRRSQAETFEAALRVVIYARVSQDDSKSARSCDEQIRGGRADCEERGFTVVDVKFDNDRGASRHSRGIRKDFNQLPEVLQPGMVLWVWEPSRITRDPEVFGPFCRMMVHRGVRLFYDGKMWDLDDDEDRNRVWQDILDGAKEAAKIRKRVRRALGQNLRDGKPHGRQPAGYRIERDERSGKSTGERIPIPAQASILQHVAERVLLGEPLNLLSRELAPRWHAAGGGVFGGRDIKRILTSPTTFGMRGHFNETPKKGTWEPLVDPELFPQLCALLNDPSRRSHRGSDPKYLMSFIALCSVCRDAEAATNIIRRMPPSRPGGRDYYACPRNHVGRDRERVDLHVTELLLDLLSRKEYRDRLFAPVPTLSPVDSTVKIIRLQIKDVARRVAEEGMTLDMAAALDAQLAPKLLKAEMAEAEARRRIPPALLKLLDGDPRLLWEDLTIIEQRDVIRQTFTIVIHPVGKNRWSGLGLQVLPVSPQNVAE